MRSHEKLDVWKAAIDFVVEIYRMTESFPSDERYGLTSQIRRASVSIPSNIAEGAARNSDKDFVRLLYVAQGSASEVETQLLIANRLGYIPDANHDSLRAQLDEIGRMAMGLINYLKRKAQKDH